MDEEILKKIEESAKRLGCGNGELLHEFCLFMEEFLQNNLDSRKKWELELKLKKEKNMADGLL